MPHLRLCGLHFRVGSDDFVLPGLLGIVYRTTWTACCAAILDFARKGSSCGSGLMVYLSLAVGLYATSILIEVGVVWQSRRGTMAEVVKRSSVGTLLQLHTCVLLCELGCSIYGALLLWNRVMNGQLTKCSSELIYQQDSMTALLSAVVISQFINVLGFSTCACCSLRNESKASSDDHALQKWLQRQKMLTFGAFCCSCSLTGGKRLFGQSSLIELEQVAMTLTQFFHHSGFLDLVPTDVIAGLLLVRMQQRASAAASATATTPTTTANVLASVENDADVEASQHLYEGNDESYSRKSVLELSGHEKRAQHVNAAPRRMLDAQSKEEDKQLLELVYYGNFFAWGVYSYFMYLFSYPFTGWCRLCSAACGHCTGIQPLMTASGSGSGSSRNNAVVHGDGCSSANTLSMHFMLQHHGKIQATLLYASFVNDVAKPPFSIHIDEANKKVVISVRGTWSLEDVVTDGKVLPLDLEDLGKEWGFDGKNRVAHRGFAEAAVHICREIEEKKLLEQFDWTSTRLLFVGHSMGAAVAALMALFYSQKYPSNYCLGYGMPGSVVDEVTASELSSRILSIGEYDEIARTMFSLFTWNSTSPLLPPPFSLRKRHCPSTELSFAGTLAPRSSGQYCALQSQQV